MVADKVPAQVLVCNVLGFAAFQTSTRLGQCFGQESKVTQAIRNKYDAIFEGGSVLKAPRGSERA